MTQKDKQGLPPRRDESEWEDDLNVVASAMECTGLMPTPPTNEAEAESYSDIYPVPEVGNPVNNGLQQEKGTNGGRTSAK